MGRKIAAITGTRADYGLMRPVFEAIQNSDSLALELIVTGMHLLPEFQNALAEIKSDGYGRLHFVNMTSGEDSGKAMAQSTGTAVVGMASSLEAIKPDVVLLQGDRGEMLAGAICAAHMNIPIVHMSGGDYSGSIDDSIRNSISKFSHIHLTTCSLSTERLLGMGEPMSRIWEVGEPGLDVIKHAEFMSAEEIASQLELDLSKPVILATQHPVTTEVDQAAWQMEQVLEALSEIGIQTVFTYPNSDAGGREMIKVLEGYKVREFLRIVPNLGSKRYLSMMRIASVLVGNSSSGILEAPSFKLPVVNVGTRQNARLRANNVIDVGYSKEEIADAIRLALEDKNFKNELEKCVNPYGDGTTALKTVEILSRLKLTPGLITKWIPSEESFVVD
jgi:UDP-N-acetylglucosamine 2-epimerase (non-hydrolysing)/GDP/UDP-N,N'-diacetylbacillosamine 2-epimerase (hydrolysing)